MIGSIYPYTSLEVSFTVLLQKLLRNILPLLQKGNFVADLLQNVDYLSTFCSTIITKDFTVLNFKIAARLVKSIDYLSG
jgi:hypothetical protein